MFIVVHVYCKQSHLSKRGKLYNSDCFRKVSGVYGQRSLLIESVIGTKNDVQRHLPFVTIAVKVLTLCRTLLLHYFCNTCYVFNFLMRYTHITFSQS